MRDGLVKDLSFRGREWPVTVRLARIWENKDQSHKMYELGFLLIDEQGNMIEACLPADKVSLFTDRLKEGIIYKIEHFMIAAARPRYRATDHSSKIRITQSTKIREIDPQPDHFPLYAYNAKPFDVLAKRVEDTTILSDVVGLVYKFTDVIPSRTNNDPRRQIFIKEDIERNAIVTLWGQHAEQFNAEALYEASLDNNVTVLFMGMIVDNYLGGLAFKGTHLTRWLFNPIIPEVEAINARFEGERYIISWEGHQEPENEPTGSTLAALARQEKGDIVRKTYNFKVRIIQVKNLDSWWFHACKKCWRKMVYVDNHRRCPNCQQVEDTQRFRLILIAKDVCPEEDADEVIGEFVFFDKYAVSITGKEASILASQARGRSNYLPPAIANVINKEYAITAEVKQDTYETSQGHIILKVSKVEEIKSALLSDKTQDPSAATATDVSAGTLTSHEGTIVDTFHLPNETQDTSHLPATDVPGTEDNITPPHENAIINTKTTSGSTPARDVLELSQHESVQDKTFRQSGSKKKAQMSDDEAAEMSLKKNPAVRELFRPKKKSSNH